MQDSGSAENLRLDILEQLKRIPTMPKRKTSLFYKLGLGLASLTMLLLPLIYVALIGAVIWMVGIHAIYSGPSLFKAGSLILILLAYVGPLVIGGTLIVFMTKPLFAKKAFMGAPYKVNKDNDPFLFSYINEVARIVGAPAPKEIRMNTDVNAYAGFRRGYWSMLFSGDLMLAIGLPTISGLSLQELTGVLAHEFGHFTQGSAMRLSYVIRSTNFWFARVVYERDSMDDWIKYHAENSDVRIAIILHLTRMMIWCTRQVLKLLMYIGNIISSFLLRQMEFDADQCEIHLAGSASFESTATMMFKMSLGEHLSQQHAMKTWQEEKRLADNWGDYILSNTDEFPDTDMKMIIKEMLEEKTGLFDSHPSTGDRIGVARLDKSAGQFKTHPSTSERIDADQAAKETGQLNSLEKYDITKSSRILFANFDVIAKGLTRELYKEALDINPQPEQLVPVDVIMEKLQSAKETNKIVKRFYQAQLSALRPLSLPDAIPQPQEDFSTLGQQVVSDRETIESQRAAYEAEHDELEKAIGRRLELKCAETLIDANFTIDKKLLDLADAKLLTVRSAIRGVEADLPAFGEKMMALEASFERRLLTSFKILQLPDYHEQDPKAPLLIERLKAVWPATKFVCKNMERLNTLQTEFQSMMVLVNNLENASDNSAYRHFQSLHNTLREKVDEFSRQATVVPYPFSHSQENITVAKYLCNEFAPEKEYDKSFELVSTTIENFFSLYYRIFGSLAEIAEHVESEVGLPLMVDPPENDAPA